AKYLSRELSRELSSRSRAFFELIMPPIDIYEEGSELVVVADMAGFDKQSIKTTLSGSVLTISAKREAQDGVVFHWEQRPLKLHRVIPLPLTPDPEGEVTAKYENGVLTVRVPVKGARSVKVE
ncbi:MAG: archaeal heat shock protein Hsp14, partial [Conexivisphaera sp.]